MTSPQVKNRSFQSLSFLSLRPDHYFGRKWFRPDHNFRLFGRTKNHKVRETAYNTLVRPQLEYAPWACLGPTHILGKKYFSSKKCSAGWTTNSFDYRSSTTEIVNNLGWRTLEQRRADARLCLFFKIVHGLVAVPLPEHLLRRHKVVLHTSNLVWGSRSINRPSRDQGVECLLGSTSSSSQFINSARASRGVSVVH